MDAIRGFNQVGTPRDLPGGPIDDRFIPDAGEDLDLFADPSLSPLQHAVDPPGGWGHGLDGIDSFLASEDGLPALGGAAGQLDVREVLGDGVDLAPLSGETQLYGLDFVAGAHPLDGLDDLDTPANIDSWSAFARLNAGGTDLENPPSFPFHAAGDAVDGVDVNLDLDLTDSVGFSPLAWGPPAFSRAGFEGQGEVLFDGLDPDARLSPATGGEPPVSEIHEFDGADLGAIAEDQGEFWGASLPPYLFGAAGLGVDQLDADLQQWLSLPEDAAHVDGFELNPLG